MTLPLEIIHVPNTVNTTYHSYDTKTCTEPELTGGEVAVGHSVKYALRYIHITSYLMHWEQDNWCMMQCCNYGMFN